MKLTAKPGRRSEVADALAENLDRILTEDGTLIFAWHEDRRADDVLWAYELYRDRGALVSHGEWAQDALAAIVPLLAAEPEVSFATPAGGKGLPGA